MTDSSEPRFVDTTLRYFTPPADGSKAWTNTNVDPSTGKRASNWEYTTHPVKVENLRGRAKVTLDKNGFQFFHHPPGTRCSQTTKRFCATTTPRV
ncbi:hypothetical protein H4582DRAFT_1531282 [Lactarius indigo]|nr:hypothetical protein H4582DRAFT_1531282 [Lactarius indigo]